jgi:hypothetical protein
MTTADRPVRFTVPMPRRDPRRVLTRRELNRATLARQLLLERSHRSVAELLEHLVGMQAQTPHTAYVGVWSRLAGFDPEELSRALEHRAVVRLALMRSTIHMVTAPDAWRVRPLVQPVLERMYRNTFGRRMTDLDPEAVVAAGRAFVDERPRTFLAIGEHLGRRWPDRDPQVLAQAVRAGVPLVQVPPRGLWGRSGPVAHTSIEAWLGAPPPGRLERSDLIVRYLGAFGPASVADAQTWSGLNGLREVFDGLRTTLVAFEDERGRELFDLPDAPRPAADVPAPPRFLYDFDNILLSHADRTRMLTPEQGRALTSRNGPPAGTCLVDGVVVAGWRVARDRGRARLTITPLAEIAPDALDDLAAEGRSLLAFVAAETDDRLVEIGPSA